MQQNHPETVTNENDKEIPKETPKERYISSEKRQENTDEPKLTKYYSNEILNKSRDNWWFDW